MNNKTIFLFGFIVLIFAILGNIVWAQDSKPDRDFILYSEYTNIVAEKGKSLDLDIKLFRRNIIVSGVHLNSLIGKRFKIGEVEFEGLTHCSPCIWMNAAMKKGAYMEMKGRGGLRVKVLKGGDLSCGATELWSEEELNENPLTPLRLSKIPK